MCIVNFTSSSKFVLSSFKVLACIRLKMASNTSHDLFSSFTPIKQLYNNSSILYSLPVKSTVSMGVLRS